MSIVFLSTGEKILVEYPIHPGNLTLAETASPRIYTSTIERKHFKYCTFCQLFFFQLLNFSINFAGIQF